MWIQVRWSYVEPTWTVEVFSKTCVHHSFKHDMGHEWMHAWMDGWMDGWMHGWMDGWMNETWWAMVQFLQTQTRLNNYWYRSIQKKKLIPPMFSLSNSHRTSPHLRKFSIRISAQWPSNMIHLGWVSGIWPKSRITSPRAGAAVATRLGVFRRQKSMGL